MTGQTSDLGIEFVQLLGTLREIDTVQWDMLGEHLRVRAFAGPFAGRLAPVNWALTPESAAQLHTLLGQALAEKGSAVAPRQ